MGNTNVVADEKMGAKIPLSSTVDAVTLYAELERNDLRADMYTIPTWIAECMRIASVRGESHINLYSTQLTLLDIRSLINFDGTLIVRTVAPNLVQYQIHWQDQMGGESPAPTPIDIRGVICSPGEIIDLDELDAMFHLKLHEFSRLDDATTPADVNALRKHANDYAYLVCREATPHVKRNIIKTGIDRYAWKHQIEPTSELILDLRNLFIETEPALSNTKK